MEQEKSPMEQAAIGLCAGCRHARPVKSERGARFLLCERSIHDGKFQKYPRLPVVQCPGYEPVTTIHPIG
jgi:hypothetical protein